MRRRAGPTGFMPGGMGSPPPQASFRQLCCLTTTGLTRDEVGELWNIFSGLLSCCSEKPDQGHLASLEAVRRPFVLISQCDVCRKSS